MVGLIASIGTGLLLLNMAVVGCFCLLNRQQRSERSLRSLPPSSAMSASASVSIGEATLKQILDEEAMAAAASAEAAGGATAAIHESLSALIKWNAKGWAPIISTWSAILDFTGYYWVLLGITRPSVFVSVFLFN